MPLKDRSVWNFLLARLERECAAVLVVVESTSGSPGRQGFKMAVDLQGERVGTVGGGAMEFKLIRRARELLQQGATTPILLSQVHSERAEYPGEHSGMICSGSQEVAIFPLAPQHLDLVKELRGSSCRCTSARLTLSPRGVECHSGTENTEPYRFIRTAEFEWRYEENLSPQHVFYIVGGGHVGSALSRIMATLDFYTILFDERADLDLFRENTHAHEKICVPFTELGRHIEGGDKSYVAVVSTNIRTDEAALRALIEKPLAYLGVMGSKEKIARLKETLRECGASRAEISRLSAPIGININSREVEEIAISIAAEVIKCRNSRFQSTREKA